MTAHKAFEIGKQTVRPGARAVAELPVAAMPHSATPFGVEVMVLHGRSPGPTVWISAAVHGDEVNGVAIVRELASTLTAKSLSGTLLLAPVVNVFGFISRDRYLPDGRDLNRSFPGSARGSLAARLAHVFLTEIVRRCDAGIDLHTATRGRANLPQVRADLEEPTARRLANAFAAPVTYGARTRSGSLRGVAAQHGIPVLVYESGQAHRFDDAAIQIGVRGIRAVLGELGMLDPRAEPAPPATTWITDSKWVRAGRSGILAARKGLGDRVEAGEILAIISDPFGRRPVSVSAPANKPAGLVIGRTEAPLVLRGDATFHIGYRESGSAPLPGPRTE